MSAASGASAAPIAASPFPPAMRRRPCAQAPQAALGLFTAMPQVVVRSDSSVGTGPSSVTISRCADHTRRMAYGAASASVVSNSSGQWGQQQL